MIIWDEIKYGEIIYNNGEIKTKKWQYKELKCLIKFMRDRGYKPKDIKEKLNQCCQDDIKYLTSEQKKNIFNRLITKCKSEVVKTKDKEIEIHFGELTQIHNLNNENLEKIVFVLLVYKKWLGNLEWLSISKSDLFNTAKLSNLDSKKQQALLCELIKTGIAKSDVIMLNKSQSRGKDSKKQMWHLNIEDTDDEFAFKFNNYENFIFRYLNYFSGGYLECKCGDMCIKKSNNQEMCNKCFNEHRKKYKSEKQKLYRSK